MPNFLTRKIVLFAAAALVLGTGCKKDKDDDDNNNPGGGANLDYNPQTTGSTWTYQLDDGTSYTLTASSKDTVAASKTYKVFTNSNGPNIYKAKSGTDYYQFVTISELGANGVDLLYLKDGQAVNATWQTNQVLNVPTIPLPLNATFKYTVKETGISKTVKSKAYSDVVHVRLDVTVAGLGSLGGGDFYYSKGVGMIEGSLILNYAGNEVLNQTDQLTAYTIK